MGSCISCGRDIKLGAGDFKCPACGVLDPIPQSRHPASASASSKGRLNRSGASGSFLGLTGAFTLFVGAFLPVVTVPIVGSMNYLQADEGWGYALLLLSFIAAFLAAARQTRWLLACGMAVGAMLGITLTRLRDLVGTVNATLDDLEQQGLGELSDGGILDAWFSPFAMEWGWVVLVSGAILIFLGGIRGIVASR